ncbi:type-2 angiotensin II receptor-like [Salvelinus fontinalis]|uniref:type-2 angiotensin II receptor-like n=1 Tax=Salvelinus fontinalis TaxID=8038 RepID=UPI002485253B|nr:type-2 angiotensin II receptor-like [Salvelinus fontinalis]
MTRVVCPLATTLSNLSMATNTSQVPMNNSSSCDSISPSLHQNKLIPTIFSFIFVFGFVGNVLVVFVLCQKSNRKTVANTYIVNLALSDLLFLISLPFWAVYYSVDYNWVFGGLMCKLCGSLLSLNVYASIYFITCMSVDLYRAIVYPLQSQCSRNLCWARVVSCVIWTIAGLMTIPTMAFRDTYHLEDLGVTACALRYPPTQTNWFPGLALTKNILAFLVPFTVITSYYCCIGKHLLGAQPSLEKSSSNLDRVMKMVVAVVLVFLVCWFPFHFLTFMDVLSTLGVMHSCWVRQAIITLMPFTLCLGFFNSAINPVLYCFVGIHFREQLWRLYEEKAPRLCQKRDSIRTRLSSFSRNIKDTGQLETLGKHSRDRSESPGRTMRGLLSDV